MTALVVFTSLITIMPSLGVTRALGIGKREGASAVVEGIPLGLAAGVGSLTGSSFAAGVAAGWETGFPCWGGGPPAWESVARLTSKPPQVAASKLIFLNGRLLRNINNSSRVRSRFSNNVYVNLWRK